MQKIIEALQLLNKKNEKEFKHKVKTEAGNFIALFFQKKKGNVLIVEYKEKNGKREQILYYDSSSKKGNEFAKGGKKKLKEFKKLLETDTLEERVKAFLTRGLSKNVKIDTLKMEKVNLFDLVAVEFTTLDKVDEENSWEVRYKLLIPSDSLSMEKVDLSLYELKG